MERIVPLLLENQKSSFYKYVSIDAINLCKLSMFSFPLRWTVVVSLIMVLSFQVKIRLVIVHAVVFHFLLNFFKPSHLNKLSKL